MGEIGLEDCFACLMDRQRGRFILYPLSHADTRFLKELEIEIDYFPYQSAGGLEHHWTYLRPMRNFATHMHSLFVAFEQYEAHGYRPTWEQYSGMLEFMYCDAGPGIPEAQRMRLEEELRLTRDQNPDALVAKKTAELLYNDLFPEQYCAVRKHREAIRPP